MADVRQVWIDCDPGIDDAMAIWLALASEAELSVRAITAVSGNLPLQTTERAARELVAFAGRPDIPVHKGAARPLTIAPHFAEHVHGANGLGNVSLDGELAPLAHGNGVTVLPRAIGKELGLAVVAVGPLTDIAISYDLEPEAMKALSELVVMGGAIETGNVTPHAEFNVFADPEAWHVVVEAGLNPVIFPLETTHQALVTQAMIDDLAARGGRVAEAAAKMLTFYNEAVGAKYGGVHIHDAMAMAWLIWPELFEVQAAEVRVDTSSGEERGRTRFDFGSSSPNCRVATKVDASTFTNRLFDRLASLG